MCFKKKIICLPLFSFSHSSFYVSAGVGMVLVFYAESTSMVISGQGGVGMPGFGTGDTHQASLDLVRT